MLHHPATATLLPKVTANLHRHKAACTEDLQPRIQDNLRHHLQGRMKSNTNKTTPETTIQTTTTETAIHQIITAAVLLTETADLLREVHPEATIQDAQAADLLTGDNFGNICRDNIINKKL